MKPMATRRRHGAAIAATILVAAACAATTVQSPGAASPAVGETAGTSSPSIKTSPIPSGPPRTIEAAGATHIDVSGQPDWVALAEGSAWVAVVGGVRKIDGATDKVDGLVPIDDVVCLAMDVGFDSVWAGGCEKHFLARIEPKTGLLFTPVIDLPIRAIQQESSIGAGEGGVWLVSVDHELLRVDPITNRAGRDMWPLPEGAAAARAGLGFIWVTVSPTDTLLRISPADPKTSEAIKVGEGPRFLAVGEDAVWVMNQGDGSVTRVDKTGAVVATIPVSDVPIQGGDIAVGGGAVWVRTEQDLVVRIDPATNAVIERYGPPSGSGSVAADDDALWVSAHDSSSMWRLPLR
jgi:streptogramin lyase